MPQQPEINATRSLNPGGFHQIAWYRWRSQTGPRRATVLCVHGLTRNGRDFDRLAEALTARLPVDVVAVDIAGRGNSDWLADASFYNYPQYMSDMTVLIARLKPERLFWVGTSMGGLIGMMMAAQPQAPIERLVLNDVGPFVPLAALMHIRSYIGGSVKFAREAEFASHLRALYASFGVPDEAGWQHLIAHSQRRNEDGTISYNYDPKIAATFAEVKADIDLWKIWDQLKCPVLTLRGVESGLLLPETALEMSLRGPRSEIVVCPECGHAPSLMRENEIGAITRFLAC